RLDRFLVRAAASPASLPAVGFADIRAQTVETESALAVNSVFTLPLVGRVARRSAAKAGGVGVVVSGRISRANSDPRPQPLPTRGRGADRVGCPVVRQIERNTP